MLRVVAMLAVLAAWPLTIGDGWQAPLPPSTPRATKIALGYVYACARMADSTVRCWGAIPTELGGMRSVAEPIAGFTDIVDVQMWGYHTCFIHASGERKCWGLSGDPPPRACTLSGGVVTCRVVQTLNERVVVMTDASELANGALFSCALRRDRSVWCWGSNLHHELGNGTTTAATAPRRVPGLDDVVQLVAGDAHACARRDHGEVVCWGGSTKVVDSPVPLRIAGLEPAVQLETTRNNACTRSADGQIQCWGDGFGGWLGDGLMRARAAPVAVRWTRLQPKSHSLPPGVHAVTVVADGASTCALIDDGTVRCWGDFDDDALQPRALPGVTDAVRLEIGSSGFRATERDGSLVRWAAKVPPHYDGRGLVHDDDPGMFDCRLGIDHVVVCADLHGPARLPHVVALSQTMFGPCALLEDRSVSCFVAAGGWRHRDQFDGARQLAMSARNVCLLAGDRARCFFGAKPTDIAGMVDVDYLTPGPNRVCAHQRSGHVSCWGGDEAPVEERALFGATSIAITNDHTCAVFAGDVKCWGNNDHGQLGDGTTERHDSPQRVAW